jgi:hypothetical protein
MHLNNNLQLLLLILEIFQLFFQMILKQHSSFLFEVVVSKLIQGIPLSSIAVLELKTLEDFLIQLLDLFLSCFAL